MILIQNFWFREGKKKQNVKCVRFDVNGEARVLLIASRDIQKGERLYYDYNGYEHEYPTQHFVWPCLCCSYVHLKSFWVTYAVTCTNANYVEFFTIIYNYTSVKQQTVFCSEWNGNELLLTYNMAYASLPLISYALYSCIFLHPIRMCWFYKGFMSD